MSDRSIAWVAALPAIAVLVAARAAGAAELSAGDTAWMLTSSALVLMMTLPGLALFYGGLVRAKNVLSVLMQCAIAAALVSLLWVIAGYSLAFAEGNAFIGDLSKAGLSGITKDTLWLTIPEYVFVAFQGMFAIITPALMLGAFAERMRFSAYLAFIAVWLFVGLRAARAHGLGGGGWIGANLGAIDFAGGLVVHTSSGFSALAAALVPRARAAAIGKEPMPPHNLPLARGRRRRCSGSAGSASTPAARSRADGLAGARVPHHQHRGRRPRCSRGCAIEWLHRGKPTVLGAATAAGRGARRDHARLRRSSRRSARSAIGVGVGGGLLCRRHAA